LARWKVSVASVDGGTVVDVEVDVVVGMVVDVEVVVEVEVDVVVGMVVDVVVVDAVVVVVGMVVDVVVDEEVVVGMVVDVVVVELVVVVVGRVVDVVLVDVEVVVVVDPAGMSASKELTVAVPFWVRNRIPLTPDARVLSVAVAIQPLGSVPAAAQTLAISSDPCTRK
jgi:hypothetical protein